MGKGFRKFKRKMCVGAILRVILAGLSVEVIAVAAQLLMAKLTMGNVDIPRFALLSAPVAAITASILLALLLPTNRRLARRLDRSLGLGEKVQTMVAFRRETGEMLELQRADTEAILQKTPRRRLRGVATWLFVALPLVAALTLGGTLLVPAKEPPEEPPTVDASWYLTPFQRAKLEALIREVEESEMEEVPREATVRHLENLLNQLGAIRKESVMQKTVTSTIESIHADVSDHNTYDLMVDAMQDVPSESIRRLGSAVGTLKPMLINEQLLDMRALLDTPEGRADAAHMAAALRQAITASTLPMTDPLTVALTSLADDLDTVTSASTEAELDDLRSAAEASIGEAITPASVNETVEFSTIETLRAIFGLPDTVIPPDLLEKDYNASGEGSYEEDDDPEKNNTGGLGSGEVLFGSNDTIYDPDKGTYVTYGEVLRRYHATVLEYIGTGGSIPEELEDMLHDYFTKLSDGSDQKDADS